ncbi:MAG: CoB--CoM heterodisulfide reductase iron-sulfur subunit B family protein [Bacillota bacterium]|jgi:heterodisulfide reductase subunit B
MRYGYMPGCSSHASSVDYEASTKAVAKALGIDLVEIEDWNCCGTAPISSVNPEMAVALSARNLALAEEQGFDAVVTACAACFNMLYKAWDNFASNPGMRKQLEEAMSDIGRTLKGKAEVRHLLDIIVNDYGLEKIEQLVTKKLTGLKVVPYYGCLLGRPKSNFEDAEEPNSMDGLLAMLGTEVLDSDFKARCCGSSTIFTKRSYMLRLLHDILEDAQRLGGDMIVVACPLCQMNLDAYQTNVNSAYGTSFNIPVVYFTQLLGLALGLSPQQLAMDKAFVSSQKVLNRVSNL